MKNVVITGHTRGIGKSISEHLTLKSWHVVGFAKSLGQDIRLQNIQEQVVESCKEASLFINNAHGGFAQTELLFKVFELWKNSNKTIVNIGVDCVPVEQWTVVHRPYPVEKVALHSAILELQNTQRQCRVINFSLNHVDTESNKDSTHKKLSLLDINHTLDWVLNQPDHLEIKTIVLAAKE